MAPAQRYRVKWKCIFPPFLKCVIGIWAAHNIFDGPFKAAFISWQLFRVKTNAFFLLIFSNQIGVRLKAKAHLFELMKTEVEKNKGLN